MNNEEENHDIEDNPIYQFIQSQLKLRTERMLKYDYRRIENNIIGVIPIRRSYATTAVAYMFNPDTDVYVSYNTAMCKEFDKLLKQYDKKMKHYLTLSSMTKIDVQEIKKALNAIKKGLICNIGLNINRQLDIVVDKLSDKNRYERLRGIRCNRIFIDVGSFGYCNESYKISKLIEFIYTMNKDVVIIIT